MMEVSQEYILMCEKAVEMQKTWEPQEGDYAYSMRSGAYLLFDSVIALGDALGRFQLDHIWLPRQDQLQEMAHWGGRSVGELLWIFARWQDERGEDGLYAHQFTSFEQLWLAFVMDTIYNKTWNGDDWKSAV